jgi:uncharacterized protein with FMN-binding domain
MRRAPFVLAATAAGTAALLAFHPQRSTTSAAVAPGKAPAGGRTVTGTTAATPYGPVQVRITVTGGRVADVAAVQLPQQDERSSQISAYAAPLLRQEALTAQSASIDGVSGATFTSAGYEASLRAAVKSAGV